jgi:hypothetical protein
VIEVELPASREAVRYLPSFEADLPSFALDMDDISAFRFGDVSLKSTNSHIKVRVIILPIYACTAANLLQGAIASTFNVHSTNGGISGAFNTTNSLTIVTTNSPVSVRIGAVNEKSEKPTNVLLQTTNGFVPLSLSPSAH